MLLTEIEAAVGATNLLVAEADKQRYLRDWLGKYSGAARAVVRPKTAQEAADVLAICRKHGVPVVPQGGNTGMSGGATPDGSADAILLSLERMRAIRAVDTIGNTMTVEAGMILADVQRTAMEAGRLFPLSLGAEGSCTIGGNLATNAGGIAVLRYGTMRDLALGLEVALADGRVWNGLSALYKDNTGYSLRNLFIGSEGTLGVITAAVLKLFPLPQARAVAVAAVAGLEPALELLAHVRDRCGDRLVAFEYMSGASVDLVLDHVEGVRLPLAQRPAGLVLVELADMHDDIGLRAQLEGTLGAALESGLAEDAAVAQDMGQATDFWRPREAISEALVRAGKALKHDVSVPVAQMAAFAREAAATADASPLPTRPIVFGHLGDGNLHYNLLPQADAAPGVAAELTRRLHDVVARFGGSISAEHGIGQLRIGELARLKPALDLELMQGLKRLLDPSNILNPGKLLPARSMEEDYPNAAAR
jgi:FAD/FMN-containing dehydrogenase